MRKHNLAFIDLETTGLDPERHEIIEIGCLVARPSLEVIAEFEQKVRPTHLQTAEPEALNINGYNEADWLFSVDLSQAVKLLAEKTADCIMVGQNVSFDWGFLQKAFTQTGVRNQMHFHKLDVISMAYAKLHGQSQPERFGLSALAEYFKIEQKRAHSALDDVRVTFEIYKKLLQ